MNVVSMLVGLLTGKAGEQVGGVVSVGAQIAALLAAVAPVAFWLTGNKDETFIALSYGDLTFWGVILLLIVRLVHRAPAPEA